MLRRRELLAYLIGAGVAGTILVAPFLLRDAGVRLFLAEKTAPPVPIFLLLPVVWGLWNLVWARHQPRIGIGAWGATLGLAASLAANLYLLWQQAWFPAALVLTIFLPGIYYLLWHVVVGPLNEALGVEGEGLH